MPEFVRIQLHQFLRIQQLAILTDFDDGCKCRRRLGFPAISSLTALVSLFVIAGIVAQTKAPVVPRVFCSDPCQLAWHGEAVFRASHAPANPPVFPWSPARLRLRLRRRRAGDHVDGCWTALLAGQTDAPCMLFFIFYVYRRLPSWQTEGVLGVVRRTKSLLRLDLSRQTVPSDLWLRLSWIMRQSTAHHKDRPCQRMLGGPSRLPFHSCFWELFHVLD